MMQCRQVRRQRRRQRRMLSRRHGCPLTVGLTWYARMVYLRQLNAIDFDLRGGAGGGAAHVTRRKRNRMRWQPPASPPFGGPALQLPRACTNSLRWRACSTSTSGRDGLQNLSLATAKQNAILSGAPSFRSAANAGFGRAN